MGENVLQMKPEAIEKYKVRKRKEKKGEKLAQLKETVPYGSAEGLGLLLQLRELLGILRPAQQFILNSCHHLWMSGSARAHTA